MFISFTKRPTLQPIHHKNVGRGGGRGGGIGNSSVKNTSPMKNLTHHNSLVGICLLTGVPPDSVCAKKLCRLAPSGAAFYIKGINMFRWLKNIFNQSSD